MKSGELIRAEKGLETDSKRVKDLMGSLDRMSVRVSWGKVVFLSIDLRLLLMGREKSEVRKIEGNGFTCVHTYIYIHTHTRVYVYVCVCVYVSVCVCVCVCVCR
jgi:hypothetical protein